MRNRRSFLKAGGALAGAAILPGSMKAVHQHQSISGPLASATVSFGQWKTDPPLNRFPNINAPIVPAQHQLIPNEVKIKAGGAVNFIIAGFHQVIVYGDGTQAADINVNLTVPPTAGAPPLLINDPNNRIYRGR